MAARQKRDWWVYLLACGDGSHYCGIAKDVAARLAQHQAGKGAKYTRGRGPLTLLGTSAPVNRSEALRAERQVKKQPKAEKLAFLQTVGSTSWRRRQAPDRKRSQSATAKRKR